MLEFTGKEDEVLQGIDAFFAAQLQGVVDHQTTQVGLLLDHLHPLTCQSFVCHKLGERAAANAEQLESQTERACEESEDEVSGRRCKRDQQRK